MPPLQYMATSTVPFPLCTWPSSRVWPASSVAPKDCVWPGGVWPWRVEAVYCSCCREVEVTQAGETFIYLPSPRGLPSPPCGWLRGLGVRAGGINRRELVKGVKRGWEGVNCVSWGWVLNVHLFRFCVCVAREISFFMWVFCELTHCKCTALG